ncbi:hypothetical protein MMC20_004217 [Loxospora ochrophaea]|nr:hypothetical protein [Loxospora ochrophaea]
MLSRCTYRDIRTIAVDHLLSPKGNRVLLVLHEFTLRQLWLSPGKSTQSRHFTTTLTKPRTTVTQAKVDPAENASGLVDFERGLNAADESLPKEQYSTKIPRALTRGGERQGLRGHVIREASSKLIEALERAGHHHAVPRKFTNKLDLSTVSPRSLQTWKKWGGKTPRTKAIGLIAEGKGSIQELLATYISTVQTWFRTVGDTYDHPRYKNRDQALLRIFSDDAIALLSSKGFDATDLVTWAWILTARSSERAMLRLLVVSSRLPKTSAYPVSRIPTFVYLFLLRRPHMSSRAIRLAIIHAWDRIRNVRSMRWTKALTTNPDFASNLTLSLLQPRHRIADRLAGYPVMLEPTIMTVAVRLMRHARRHWPVGLISIAAMVTDSLRHPVSRGPLSSSTLDSRSYPRLSFLYNKVLHLLALPSSQNPFRSIPHHQRAQFNVVREMNKFTPPLVINREGYRAVARVQLAHRKVLGERNWARMKAQSWPPWKQDKLGIDAEVGVQQGESRATQSLLRLQEAGYAFGSWERAANVLAGWDTDRSPSIQTRTVLRDSFRSRRVQELELKDDVGGIWAARIKATRTLDEAWACFLAFKEHKALPAQSVYYAMFEKLIFEAKRGKAEKAKSIRGDAPASHDSTLLAGDGREVLAPPAFQRDAIYVRVPPPTIDEFFEAMLQDGIHPSGRFLAFIVSHADTIARGVMFIRYSPLPLETIQTILGQNTLDDAQIRASLNSLPEYLFAALIRFLTYAEPPSMGRQRDGDQINDFTKDVRTCVSESGCLRIDPFKHAFRLVNARQPLNRTPWYHLLVAIARSNVFDSSLFQDISVWKTSLHVHDSMSEIGLEMDFEGFYLLCVSFEKTYMASQKLLSRLEEHISHASVSDESDHRLEKLIARKADTLLILSKGLIHLKTLFKSLVMFQSTPDDTAHDDFSQQPALDRQNKFLDPDTLLPRLLEVPSPAQLHVFIRVLGLSQDYKGISELIKWMAVFAPELKAVFDELSSGPKMMKRSLTAVRLFLERSWESGEKHYAVGFENVSETASISQDEREHIRQEVCEIVEKNPEWGGWPTDEEVLAYWENRRVA